MKQGKNTKLNRVRLTVFVLLVVIIGGTLLWFLTSCKLENFQVKGSVHYTDEEIKEKVIASPLDKYAVLLYLRYHFVKQDAIPFVEYLDPVLDDRNSITVYVYEKRITGCISFMGDYMYFDKDGVIVECSKDVPVNVPLVTGLDFQQIIMYEELQIQDQKLYDVLLGLVKLIEMYDLSVEQIHFQKDDEVVLYCGEKIVYLGKRDMYDVPLSELPSILTTLPDGKMSLDMRNYESEGDRIIAKPIE